MAAMAAVRRSPFLMTYSSTHGPLAPDDCHVHVAYLNALDISQVPTWGSQVPSSPKGGRSEPQVGTWLMSSALRYATRSEEHTSELQSQSNLVCRLLLEK